MSALAAQHGMSRAEIVTAALGYGLAATEA